jgi:hypothetical protein
MALLSGLGTLRYPVRRPVSRSQSELNSARSPPLWAQLLTNHQPIDNQLVDHVLDVVWPGLSAGCASATDDPSRESAQ